MRGKTLLNMLDDGIDIAESDPFFCRQFQLPANPFFVKCDERELLPGFTAEADQLELLSRSKTVTVPKVWAVGADRD
ncbi:fructosamine kinase family protein, partial [Escherichia coli]|uniref:fructosamine kinase family protein n=1 Tax=Escherichia coli TaxID=562 RepID=UPI003D9A4B5E